MDHRICDRFGVIGSVFMAMLLLPSACEVIEQVPTLDSCVGEAECEHHDDRCLAVAGVPSKVTGKICTHECRHDHECPVDGFCAVLDYSHGTCYRECHHDIDCQIGYGCVDVVGVEKDACLPVKERQNPASHDAGHPPPDARPDGAARTEGS